MAVGGLLSRTDLSHMTPKPAHVCDHAVCHLGIHFHPLAKGTRPGLWPAELGKPDRHIGTTLRELF